MSPYSESRPVVTDGSLKNAHGLQVRRTSRSSISRLRRNAKTRRRRLTLLLAVTAAVALAIILSKVSGGGEPAATTPAETSRPATTTAQAASPSAAAMQALTPDPARYELKADERDLVERVVMAEAGGESYEGQVLVAQCILNACEIDAERPGEVVAAYQYAKARPEPAQSVRDAVAAVFDQGETAVAAPILYFYNPAKTTSRWHETQDFVIEVGGHRFFAEKGADK